MLFTKFNTHEFAFSAVMSRLPRRTILKRSGATVAGLTSLSRIATADNSSISGSEGAIHLTPENAEPISEDSADTEGLKEIDYWNDDLAVSCDSCQDELLTADYHVKVFRTYEKDQDGDYHYIYWMWSQTDTDTGNPSSLTRMESKVNIYDEDMSVTSFDPDTTETMNQRSKDIALSFGFSLPGGGGASASISDTIYVNDGEYGPWQGEVDVGPAGKFGVSIDANNTTRRQTLKGGLRTRAPEREPDEWYHVKFWAACGDC